MAPGAPEAIPMGADTFIDEQVFDPADPAGYLARIRTFDSDRLRAGHLRPAAANRDVR